MAGEGDCGQAFAGCRIEYADRAAAVAHVDAVCLRVVAHVVGVVPQGDARQLSIRWPVEGRTVAALAVRHKETVERRYIADALRLVETRDGVSTPASRQVYYLHGVVSQRG